MEKKSVMKAVGGKEAPKQQKLSYEELNNICMELHQQNQYLQKELQRANMSNMFKRLDYLFQVLKCESVIKDADFINECVSEIKEAMRVPDTPGEGGQYGEADKAETVQAQ